MLSAHMVWVASRGSITGRRKHLPKSTVQFWAIDAFGQPEARAA